MTGESVGLKGVWSALFTFSSTALFTSGAPPLLSEFSSYISVFELHLSLCLLYSKSAADLPRYNPSGCWQIRSPSGRGEY